MPRSNIWPPSSAQRRMSSITVLVLSCSDAGFTNSFGLYWFRPYGRCMKKSDSLCFNDLFFIAIHQDFHRPGAVPRAPAPAKQRPMEVSAALPESDTLSAVPQPGTARYPDNKDGEVSNPHLVCEK